VKKATAPSSYESTKLKMAFVFAWPRRASFSVASAVPQVDGFSGKITFQENAEKKFNPSVPLSLIFF